MAMHRHQIKLIAAGAGAAVVLGAATTVGLAAAVGEFSGAPVTYGPGAGCDVPALSGSLVDVTLADMGGPMRGPYGPRRMHDGDRWWHMRRGMMRVYVTPQRVPHGTVSLRVHNDGVLTHELVVLPLPPGQRPGQRTVGSDGKISETNSLGESSRTCRAGSGDGIAPGANGWTTLTLKPGRYELVCNFPGHYAAGMYAELDVTG